MVRCAIDRGSRLATARWNWMTSPVWGLRLGRARPVPAGTPFNKKEIDDALAKQGLQIKKGDVVLFHTGWQEMASKDAKAFMAGEPGLGKEGAEYLVSKEVVAIGADQWGLEVIPFEKGVALLRSAPNSLAAERHLHFGEYEHGPLGGR
jgi:hypothetical protein